MQKRDACFPIDLEDVKFDQAVDILTVFDLAGNEIEQAEALPQEIVVQEQSSVAAPKGNKRRGRQHGMADFTFAERLEIIRYSAAKGFLTMHKSGRLINNLESGKRTVDVPFALKQTQVAIDTIVAWRRQSEQQRWQEMLEDPDLKKKLGDGWGSTRSRVPNEWRARLDMKPLGQPPLLRRHPELIEVLAQTDSLHEEERSLLYGRVCGGFPHPASTCKG